MLGGDAALRRITLTGRYYCRRHSILLGIAVYTEGSPVTVYQCDTVTTHGLDGQHHDVDRTPRGRVSQNEAGINGESTFVVWPTLGSRGRLKNRTELLPQRLLDVCFFRRWWGRVVVTGGSRKDWHRARLMYVTSRSRVGRQRRTTTDWQTAS